VGHGEKNSGLYQPAKNATLGRARMTLISNWISG
jgi:hypothetical protein